MFTGFLAYHHHSHIINDLHFYVIKGRIGFVDFPLFCKIIRKMVSAMVAVAIFILEWPVITDVSMPGKLGTFSIYLLLEYNWIPIIKFV